MSLFDTIFGKSLESSIAKEFAAYKDSVDAMIRKKINCSESLRRV
jgi:hypothetical protein